MPRPKKCRNISCDPRVIYFKPAGTPLRDLEEVILDVDELEAMNLVDLEGNYQEEAAKRMGVSRGTVSNLLASARFKITRALVQGMAIRLQSPKKPEEDL